MKKNINPIIKTLISIFLLLSLSSCENIFSKLEPLESANSNSSDKAYIKINVVQESSERTIIPTIDLSLLSSISLRGRKADNNNVTDANLLSGSTWEAFSSQTLSIDPGEWEFNLSASLNINSNGATTLRGTKTVTLQQGETTTLNFTLAPSSSSTTTKGGLYVKVNFEDPSKKVTKVVATLMDEAKENIQGDPQSITGTSIKSPTGSPRYIEYKISNSSTYGIEQGTYFLTLEFFAGSDSAGWVSLNTISSYVRINAYYTSAATFDLDLNELYTITYKYYLLDEELSSNTGISIAADSPSTILPTAFSRRSAITLPTLTYSDTTYQFAGWYESSDFSGAPVTRIEKGSYGNKILYARFVSSTLFVSQTGNDTNDGITVSTALATISKAIEKIISYGNMAADYTIKISGTIPGGQIISSSLTTAIATSLTLEGVTGKTGDTWVDVLDGGFTSSSKGTTLAINTAVPVTLKNLKITGGYQGGGSGAGIKLAGDSTLVMESGEISGNTGNDSGQASAAGVYISHGGTANFGATQIAGAKFTMNGGSICNNTGTGVTLYDGSNPGEFNMYGGTITGNSGYGVDLVYSTGSFGKFTMKGSAVVTSDNKVFIGLPNGTKIYIADELTGTAPVATIKLNGYNENTEVIALANGVTDTSLLSAACAKIEVAPYNGIPWYLTSDGKITATDPNAGNSGGDSATWTGSADGHDYVDLGLPSGTLWATMNVGATVENRYYGDYYSWGETEPRYTSYTISRTDDGYGGISENISVSWKSGYEDNGYSWDNYFDGTNGENFTIFKDADSSELDATHDAATVNWGANWKTPTKDQCSELINKCFMTSTNDYNNTGIAGIIVYKATAGDEGKDTFGSTPPELTGTYSLSTPHIFFPLCGRFPQNNYVSSNDLCAYLWSSTLEPSYPETAYQFSPFNTESYDPLEFDPRANGEPIRPVYVGSTGGNSGNTNSIPDDFVLVEGATITEPPTAFGEYGAFKYASSSEPVVVSNFYMCTHEVTQAEYETYCIYGGTAPAETEDKDQYPAYNINWYDAIVYCNLRSLKENLTPVYSVGKEGSSTQSVYPKDWDSIRSSGEGDEAKYCGPDERNSYWDSYFNVEVITINSSANGYRLPTNAEWEYAARGGNGLSGTQTKYSGSSSLSEVSNGYYETIEKIMLHTQNSLGIYDMNSAVNEWFLDPSGEDDYRRISTAQDPIDYNAAVNPNERSTNSMKLGFRVVRNAQ